MRITFFNFDSASASAPDELTITGTTVAGGTFTHSVTNAKLDPSGGFTISAPGGALIETLVFESGSQSSFKLGLASISSVRYDADFDISLGYKISDLNGGANSDSESGTIRIGLDGDNVMMGTNVNDSLVGTDGIDIIRGGLGNDVISGGAGGDLIQGGAGNDTLTGGGGADIFEWKLADKGANGAPAIDTITDFNAATPGAGGDMLDLRDLLQGEVHLGTDAGTLAKFLHFEYSGSDTVLYVSSSGGFAGGTQVVGSTYASGVEDQRIVLQGVNLIGAMTTDQAVIQDLLLKGKLHTD